MVIRKETSADVAAIRDVTIAAFETLEISNQTEHCIIEALRAARALTVSLLAEMDDRVVGHIAFSPVRISDGTRGWYGLGPLSVWPNRQRQGIGSALISAGLLELRKLNAQGCCVVGHREYYPRFGFETLSGLVLEGVPPDVFFALCFTGCRPQGSVTFHRSFTATGPRAALDGISSHR